MSHKQNRKQLLDNISDIYSIPVREGTGMQVSADITKIGLYWRMLVLIAWTIIALTIQTTLGNLLIFGLKHSKGNNKFINKDTNQFFVPRTDINGEVKSYEYEENDWIEEMKHYYFAPFFYSFMIETGVDTRAGTLGKMSQQLCDWLDVPRFNNRREQIEVFYRWEDKIFYSVLALVITVIPVDINLKHPHKPLTNQQALNSVYEYCATQKDSPDEAAFNWYHEYKSTHTVIRKKEYMNFSDAQVLSLIRACLSAQVSNERLFTAARNICSKTNGFEGVDLQGAFDSAFPSNIDLNKYEYPSGTSSKLTKEFAPELSVIKFDNSFRTKEIQSVISTMTFKNKKTGVVYYPACSRN